MARKNRVVPFRLPVIETRLGRAYQEFSELVMARRAIIAAGVSPDAAPSDDALRAFTILGDYSRVQVAAQVEPLYPTIEAKGLARACLADISTPELRLLAAVVDQLDPLLTVGERFEAGLALAYHPKEAVNAPQIRCAPALSGAWGQPARVHFAVSDAEWILVRPDALFGTTETLLRTGTNDFQGCFELPVEDGRVLLAAMAASGEVSTYHLNLRILREAS